MFPLATATCPSPVLVLPIAIFYFSFLLCHLNSLQEEKAELGLLFSSIFFALKKFAGTRLPQCAIHISPTFCLSCPVLSCPAVRACLFVYFILTKENPTFVCQRVKTEKGKTTMDLMDGWKKGHEAKSYDDGCSDGGGSDEVVRPPRVTSIPTNINTKKREKLNGKVWILHLSISIANFFTYLLEHSCFLPRFQVVNGHVTVVPRKLRSGELLFWTLV